MKNFLLFLTLLLVTQAFAQSPLGKYRIIDIHLSGVSEDDELVHKKKQAFATQEVQGVIIEVSSDSLKFCRQNGTFTGSAIHSIGDNRIEYYNKQMEINSMDFQRKDDGQYLLSGKNGAAYLCEKIE